MPSTVTNLLAHVGLTPAGAVSWGEPVPARVPGVYLVSRFRDPDATVAVPAGCSLSSARLMELLDRRPELRIGGARPSVEALAKRLAAFWMPDEAVVYIGKSDQPLGTRVGQYYRTPLGARAPHAGGWFLKALDSLPQLWLHYAPCDEPKLHEDDMLAHFMHGISASTRETLFDPSLPLPFANLEVKLDGRLLRKRHGITGAKAARAKTVSARG